MNHTHGIQISGPSWQIIGQNGRSPILTRFLPRKKPRSEIIQGKNLIDIITPAEVIGIKGDSHVESLIIKSHAFEKKVDADYFIPLFGLTPKLGRLQEWGLKIEKNSICVDNSIDYQTNIPGIFAIGDINIYPGKLKLILCGFHEATIMCQAAFKIINPNKKNILKYTTVTGINGFDGSKKKSESPIVKSL